MRPLIVFLLGFALAIEARAHSFLPENNLWIGPDSELTAFGGVNEERFNKVLTEIEKIYAPIVAKYGGKLVIKRLWTNGTVNAQASRQGNTWLVEMFGGLARHNAITEDGLAVVACHEIGHHLGGAPRYTEEGGKWASVEGQSDYFATAKCLRKYIRAMRSDVHAEPAARAECEKIWKTTAEAETCARAAMAGQSAANLMWELGGRVGPSPSFTNPDPNVVSQVLERHPAPQCRMDTYFNGALCNTNEDQVATACIELRNRRPSCWYPNKSNGEPPPKTLAPLINKKKEYVVTSISAPFTVTYDVRDIPDAAGVYLEISKANKPFSNPNGTEPDPKGQLTYRWFKNTSGAVKFVPYSLFQSWGTYYFRIIPLDATGATPVGYFSDSSVVHLKNPRKKFSAP